MSGKKKTMSIDDITEEVQETHEFLFDKVSNKPIYRFKGERYWHLLNTPTARAQIPHNLGIKMAAAAKKTLNDNLVSDAMIATRVDVTYKTHKVNKGKSVALIGSKVMSVSRDGVHEYSGDDDLVFLEPDDSLGDVDMDGSVEDVIELLEFLSIPHEERAQIIAWWLCTILEFETPIVFINAPTGSGKTIIADTIVGLFDEKNVNNSISLHSSDFMEIFASRRSVHIDNVSSIKTDMSDLLCKTVTGGSFMKRKLYDDSEIYMGSIVLPIAITTQHKDIKLANDLRTRLLHLHPGKKSRMIDAKEMAPIIQGKLNKVRGGILKIAASVIGQEPPIDDMTRMASYVRTLSLVEQLMPEYAGSVEAYRKVYSDNISPFVQALVRNREMLFKGHSSYNVNYKWKPGEIAEMCNETMSPQIHSRSVRKLLLDNEDELNDNGISFSEAKKHGYSAYMFSVE